MVIFGDSRILNSMNGGIKLPKLNLLEDNDE